MRDKLMLGTSETAKAFVVIKKAWQALLDGKRVLYVGRDSFDNQDGGIVTLSRFKEDLERAAKNHNVESVVNELLCLVSVDESVSDSTVEECRNLFISHQADYVFIDGVEELLTLDIFEGATSVVHILSGYPTGANLNNFEITKFGNVEKFIVGSSGSGKTIKALREAWADAKAGNRVVFAYVYGDFDVNDSIVRFALGSEYDEFINSSMIRFVKVGVDLTDDDIVKINDAFQYNNLNVLYVDDAKDTVPIDLLDAGNKFVHVFQCIPSNVNMQGVTVEETTVLDRTGR